MGGMIPSRLVAESLNKMGFGLCPEHVSRVTE
jgi:hypothetical protein